jgi:glycosyltransferase involved in cell wall biosynthesis
MTYPVAMFSPAAATERIDFVVPAHNEEATVGAVVAAIQAAPSAHTVTVVADACTDNTAAEAASHGAVVLTIDAGDKGSAMAAGLNMVTTPRVGFIDADLTGLTPQHIDQLAAQPAGVMAVGVRDTTARINSLPPIGGERILPTVLARNAGLDGAGYMAEMRLAHAAKRAGVPTVDVRLHGIGHRTNLASTSVRRWAQVGRGYATYTLGR